jgi:putative component of membrane protein insertase Oxa1/YidC/SpoIIIJ protein YidD
MQKKLFTPWIFWLIITTLVISGSAKDKMKGPKLSQNNMLMQRYGLGENFYLNFYQKWISPIKGGNTCPMFPACSQYAKTAFQYLPWYEAYPTILERLLRCGNDLPFYPTIIINRKLYQYDPVKIDSTNLRGTIEN